MKQAMTEILTHRGDNYCHGPFGLSRLLAISYWLLARKPNAKSQEPIAVLLKSHMPNNQSVEKI